MREITIKAYQYKELSHKAKEKARDWWISGGDDDQFAWDNTKEDAQQVGLVISSLDEHRTNSGKFEKSALDCANRILKEHGESCETYKTAKKYIKALNVLPVDESLDDAYEGLEALFLSNILEDYRIKLNEECEYLQSEEHIAETMEANEYEFTVDGKRI